MNIRELKQLIDPLPDHMEVFMDERLTDFRYGLVNSARVKEIPFSEDPDSEPLSFDKVLIISED